VCDTPITDRENQDMLTEHDQDINEMASDDGSDTDTEHDIEHSPSAHMYGLRRQDLERHQLQNENSSITNNTTNNTNNTTTHTTTKQQDPLASLFELLETTDAQSIAASSVHRGSNHFQTMLQPSPATGQHHLDWEDTISVVSSLAPSLAAPSMMSVASSRMTTASMAGSSSGHHHQKVYDNMKARLTGLTMEVDDKSKTLSMLKKLLREARAAHRETEEKLASREAKKLKIVRSEYESTIARHLSFIDRLLADKQSLSDKCDALTQEMSRVEKRYALRVHDVQSQHVIELKRQKELLAAGERARKERWTNEKRKEIKETTLKGLEPELQRILTKHKKELQCMEDGHLKNIRKLEIQIQKEKDDSIRSIVEQMKRERDEAVSAEVDIGRAKLRTQMKHYDDELLNYKNKYENDTSNRVNRNENEITKMSDKHMIEMEQIKRDEMERREDLARRYNEERASIERRHEDTILDIRRRTEDERNEWKKNEKIKFVEIKKNEINDIQKELTIERDEQIDLVIRRLDEETGRNQRESSNTFTTRLEEMKKEHELDLRGVRASESSWMDKCTLLTEEIETNKERLSIIDSRYNKVDCKRAEAEAELSELHSSISIQISNLRKEHANVRREDVKRQESLERTVSLLERKLEEANDNLVIVVGEERRKRSIELDTVHQRVRMTISKKDEMIMNLENDLQISKLETATATNLLERQRQELLAE